MRYNKPRTCVLCDTEYMPTSGNQKWCSTCHHPGRVAYGAAYHAAHRKEAAVKYAAYRASHKREIIAHNATPGRRASAFLGNCRSACTSTLDEVTAIHANGLDWRGHPLVPGIRYDTDHIPGGPAIALVPHMLNIVFSQWAIEHWDEVLAYKEFRDQALRLLAEREKHG